MIFLMIATLPIIPIIGLSRGSEPFIGEVVGPLGKGTRVK